MIKIIRISTVPISLKLLLQGQLKYLSHYFEIIAVSAGGKELDDVRKNEEVKTISVPINRRISIINDVISLAKICKILRIERPQIIHSITPKAGLLSMIAGYLTNVPIRMHTFTGLIFPTKKGFFRWLLIFMDRILCLCATNVYPEGEGVRKDLLKYRITGKPLKVLANGNVNGINDDYFDPSYYNCEKKMEIRKKLRINRDDFIFLFVGRLVSDKGINELIISFMEITKSYENVKLLLIGPYEHEIDPLHNETLKLIESNNDIISLGYQSDVRPYFAISNVFVFPSYREGFPNVVIQAGAMGLPCIVTDINGCNEIIVNNENGIIIPPRNSDALREKMKFLIENVCFRNTLGKNARQMIISRYQQQIVWEALLKEYKNLLANKGI